MKRASVTQAKNGLSALLDLVRHGETILIEDRGIPVAELVPVARASAATDSDRLARLERHGIIRPAAPASSSSAPRKRLLSPPPRPKRALSLSQRVIDERREGW